VPAPQAAVTEPVSVPIPPVARTLASRDELRQLSPDEAYARVVEMDTLRDYQWFVDVYPTHRLAPQIWVIIETRREAILWRRTVTLNTAHAYWNYLKRYPNGRHADEARLFLASLSAPVAPPPDYVAQADPMPPGWWDEAVDLAEVVPQGYDPPPAVFDELAPVFVVAPPPLFPYPVGFYAPPPYWLVPRPPVGVVVVVPPRLGPVVLYRLPPAVRFPPPLVARRPVLIGGRLPPGPPVLRPLPAFARAPVVGVSLPAPPPGRPRFVPLSTTSQPPVGRQPGLALPPSTRPIGPSPALGVAKPTLPPPGQGLARTPPPGTGIGGSKTPLQKEFRKGVPPGPGTAAVTSGQKKQLEKKELRKGPAPGTGTASTTPTGLPKGRAPSPPPSAAKPPPAAMMKTTPPRPAPAAKPPSRPAAAAAKPAPRRPVCRNVKGKQVCS
jgi:hypothetical protein